MAKVKQAKTNPEQRVALTLRELGQSYRRNAKSLPGKPDFSNQSKAWAVQVHGCFWHQHDCKRGTMPSHNRTEWIAKFARNKERDREVESQLQALGLKVVTVWECETKDPVHLKNTLASHLR